MCAHSSNFHTSISSSATKNRLRPELLTFKVTCTSTGPCDSAQSAKLFYELIGNRLAEHLSRQLTIAERKATWKSTGPSRELKAKRTSNYGKKSYKGAKMATSNGYKKHNLESGSTFPIDYKDYTNQKQQYSTGTSTTSGGWDLQDLEKAQHYGSSTRTTFKRTPTSGGVDTTESPSWL